MAATFPGGVKTFSTKQAGDQIASAHINDLQAEVVAIETTLGANPFTWTAYTPSWTAVTTNPSIGNGTKVGRYVRIGKTVICSITLVMGSTTTYGSGNWSLSLPCAIKNSYSVGQWASYGAGAVYHTGNSVLYPNMSDVVSFVQNAGVNYLNATTPHTWATGSGLYFFAVYETA